MSIVDEMNIHQYRNTPWNRVRWMGLPILKYPNDLIVIQNIIYLTKPSVIIETGTYHGGSALFYAGLLDQIYGEENRNAYIVTIDVLEPASHLNHKRVKFIRSSSIAYNIAHKIESFVGLRLCEERIMVLLDSSHDAEHVYKELNIYSKMVTPGCYLVVEDTNISGHPVKSLFGEDVYGGPHEAVEIFLKRQPDYVRDRSVELFKISQNPGGYLLRRG